MADSKVALRPCQEIARAIAEALAAMDNQPTEELVLKRNYIERLKREKNPERIVDELPQLAQCDYQAIPEDDIVRLHWWGIFHDKPKAVTSACASSAPAASCSPRNCGASVNCPFATGKTMWS